MPISHAINSCGLKLALMKKDSVSQIISQPCEAGFDLLYHYERRLEWDTLLRKTCLLHGAIRPDNLL